MPTELKIYLVRHGESEYNLEHRFTGNQDIGLTAKGLEQTKLIAEKLRAKNFQVAYHTRLRRSKDTLDEILKYHKNVQVIEDNRMIERSYGDFEGEKHSDFIAKYGKKQFDIYHRSYDVAPPAGESIKTVEKRVLAFINDLLVKMRNEHVSVIICGHSNSMRPFRRYFEGLTVEEMMKLENPWDQYFEYSVSVDE